MISLEDLKDFDVWKKWKNGEVELIPTEFMTKPGFVEKRTQQMIRISANDMCPKDYRILSNADEVLWKDGFITGANFIIEK